MVRYLRVSLKGTLGPSEVWSCSYVLDPSLEIPSDFNQEINDEACEALGAVPLGTTMRQSLSTAGAYTACRLELRDTDSVGFLGASEYQQPAPIAGTSSVAQNSTVSVVLSMRGNTALASGRGRVYWPALGQGPSTPALRIPSSQTAALANEWKTFLSASADAIRAVYAQGAPISFLDPAIYSPTKKTLTAVKTIRVGDVFDVQRRRRDAMPENYSVVSY